MCAFADSAPGYRVTWVCSRSPCQPPWPLSRRMRRPEPLARQLLLQSSQRLGVGRSESRRPCGGVPCLIPIREAQLTISLDTDLVRLELGPCPVDHLVREDGEQGDFCNGSSEGFVELSLHLNKLRQQSHEKGFQRRVASKPGFMRTHRRAGLPCGRIASPRPRPSCPRERPREQQDFFGRHYKRPHAARCSTSGVSVKAAKRWTAVEPSGRG